MTAAPHLLVFEADPRGHAFEWIEHLLSFVDRRRVAATLSIAVPRELARRLEPWLAKTGGPALRVYSLTPREESLCTHRNLAISGFARWWTMRRYLRRSGADHGLFLGIDHVSLPLAFGLSSPAAVSGILFRPSVHYRTFDSAMPRPKERLRDLRKAILYPMMLRNPSVRAIHSLDPYFAVYARSRYRDGCKVGPLPDPVFPCESTPRNRDTLAGDVPRGRVVFAMFGVMAERKGILALLAALARLPQPLAGRIAVIVAGAIDPAIAEAVQERAAAARLGLPGLWLKIEDRHLQASEIHALVARADVVLAPYQRFVGSSGVLMWAAGMGRPVITQGYGLLGRLVRDHGLGIAVDTTDERLLAGAIESAVCGGAGALADRERMAAFAASHTADGFAARIFDSMVPKVSATAVSRVAWTVFERSQGGHRLITSANGNDVENIRLEYLRDTR